MTKINVSNVSVGQTVVLVNTDLGMTVLATLRDGGKSGGAEFDRYFAPIDGDADGSDHPLCETDFSEAHDAGISL